MSSSIFNFECGSGDASKYRPFLIGVLATASGLFVLPALAVFLVDPFQIFHRHFLTEPSFLPQERFQNAGLIRSYLDGTDGYSAIVLGTSMSQNFLPSKVSEHLKWGKTLRLTLSAGTPREIRYMAEAAINTGRIKSVLWEIHTYYLDGDADKLHGESLFPVYLYNDNMLDDLRYLFNEGSLDWSVNLFKGKYEKNIDRLYYWMDTEPVARAFREFTARENLGRLALQLKNIRENMDEASPPPISLTYPQLIKNVLPVLKANPDIQFILYFPPVSSLKYALMTPARFSQALGMRSFLLREAESMDHVRIFAFDTEKWITGDLGNYKDVDHFGVGINDHILSSIYEGENQLTLGNVEAYSKQFAEMIENYEICPPPSPGADFVNCGGEVPGAHRK